MSAFGLAQRAVIAQSVTSGAQQAVLPPATTPGKIAATLVAIIPGEALTAYVTIVGTGSVIQPGGKAILAWIAFVGALLVGVVFTLVGFKGATPKPSAGRKAAVLIITTLALVATVWVVPGSPFEQFGTGWGMIGGVVLAVVAIPILSKLGFLDEPSQEPRSAARPS